MRMTETPDVAGESRRAAGPFGLIVLNVLLLLLLGAVSFSARADAQRPSRGDYTMAAATVNGSASSAVFIVDTANREMIAVTYEPSQRELVGVGYRNLTADTAALARGGSNR